jgi:Holliday junction resolvase RusA-like endonuclease
MKPESFAGKVSISIHHTRNRLADIDGLSAKAVIDGLVGCGILTDDSAKQVAEVRHYQSKGSPEETKIVIEEIAALLESEARDE